MNDSRCTEKPASLSASLIGSSLKRPVVITIRFTIRLCACLTKALGSTNAPVGTATKGTFDARKHLTLYPTMLLNSTSLTFATIVLVPRFRSTCMKSGRCPRIVIRLSSGPPIFTTFIWPCWTIGVFGGMVMLIGSRKLLLFDS